MEEWVFCGIHVPRSRDPPSWSHFAFFEIFPPRSHGGRRSRVNHWIHSPRSEVFGPEALDDRSAREQARHPLFTGKKNDNINNKI